MLQIVANVLPYAEKEREAALRNAIIKMQPPAEISALVIADVLRTIVSRCWNQDPTSRPEIGRCRDLLSQAVFRQLLQLPFSDVPESWAVVHNPSMGKEYDISFVEGDRYVGRPPPLPGLLT